MVLPSSDGIADKPVNLLAGNRDRGGDRVVQSVIPLPPDRINGRLSRKPAKRDRANIVSVSKPLSKSRPSMKPEGVIAQSSKH